MLCLTVFSVQFFMSEVVVAPPTGLDGEVLDGTQESNSGCYNFTVMIIDKK